MSTPKSHMETQPEGSSRWSHARTTMPCACAARANARTAAASSGVRTCGLQPPAGCPPTASKAPHSPKLTTGDSPSGVRDATSPHRPSNGSSHVLAPARLSTCAVGGRSPDSSTATAPGLTTPAGPHSVRKPGYDAW
eukprot:354119-Chlamydomonas_euryale.AAC.5